MIYKKCILAVQKVYIDSMYLYVDKGSCSQLVATLHRHIFKEASVDNSALQTTRFTIRVSARILK